MKPLFPDLSPEEELALIERYRRMTFAEKIRCIDEMNAAWEAEQIADIKTRYPHATAREIKLRVASRRIDEPELMLAAFGWDVEKEGY